MVSWSLAGFTGGIGAAPADASAQVADITCSGSATKNYNPPITNTTRVISNGAEEN